MSAQHKPVIIWLFIGAIMVFIMIAIGGITRLTSSGLSMVDWNLIMGSIPPLSEEAWQSTFEEYQKFPEYQTIHNHFTLEDFKGIFFWEFTHRLFGRLIGIVFIIPFFIFLKKGLIKGTLLKQLLILLSFGAFQGFLGWYMVSSGLVHEPRVSHFRLAAHLSTAFFTIAYSVWIALDLIQGRSKGIVIPKSLQSLSWVTLILLAIQIIFGAFVAGKDAGLIHNFWPNMNPNEFISNEVFAGSSLLDSFINVPSGIQFVHRYLAYIVVGFVTFLWFKSRKVMDKETSKRFNIAMLIVGLQFVLGVATLLLHVPLVIALLHQLGAILLLLSMVYILHRISAISK
ncbi:MAG: cytochrome c oxidase assembly protein subunit 15 [Salibacteraceae bacterium]|jgi:cytochrome c oxidase assembly protein subunit 15